MKRLIVGMLVLAFLAIGLPHQHGQTTTKAQPHSCFVCQLQMDLAATTVAPPITSFHTLVAAMHALPLRVSPYVAVNRSTTASRAPPHIA